jgi:hypothetical protein
MIINKGIKNTGLALLAVLAVSGQAGARESMGTAHHKSISQRSTDDGCAPSALSTAIDMDINNVRARVMTGGDMWWNIGEQVAEYEIPKGSGKSSQFAASCWIGGYDAQGQLKVAAQTYRQEGNDYWPGALDDNGKITKDVCAAWDYIWKVDKATILQFIALSKAHGATTSTTYDAINYWPSSGNTNAKNIGTNASVYSYMINTHSYAPFVDLNGDGQYEPSNGEYPLINGDQFLWWVFNDAGNVKQQSQTASIGVEVQTSGFAYATQDFLNNATFYNYRVINRGALTMDSTYIAVWDDCDLGWYYDDFIGCDTSRGLGIQYNGTNDDGAGGGHPVNSYGPYPPQVGLDFFQGPKRVIKDHKGVLDSSVQLGMTNFTYFNNDNSVIGNPNNGIQIYYYMTGSIANGQRFSDDFQGPGIQSKGYGSGPNSNFVFWGDPGNTSEWSECSCNNNPGDRRFIFSSGPFTLYPGAINDITFGCVWAPQPVGGCPKTSFATIRSIDDQAQALFDNGFKTVEGPQAPRMLVRELDRKLVFYFYNDQQSNNYNENYGRSDVSGSANYADSLQYHQLALKSKGSSNPNDSLYKFEGYRVFQMANGQLTPSDIFDPTTGEVNATNATEVFQCDVRNGVSQIVNYGSNLTVKGANTFPEIKVTGKDSGIVHSFELTADAFAPGADKRFVNYHSYYFIAIAYAYNNFKTFDADSFQTTQDQPYLGSSHGEGGIDIPVVSAMPNPANGDMGTIINSDYGSGVVITRVEGVGNGGNDVELSESSDSMAVYTGSAGKAVYQLGMAPIDVKVVDPVKVPAYDWVLQITGKLTTAQATTTAGWRLTAFDKSGAVQDTIYSEESIQQINEQIAENYGISISIGQVDPPGDEAVGNGYITSQVIFDDPSQPWLWGVQDQPDSNFANWLRAGNTHTFNVKGDNPCNFNDNKLDTLAAYGNMFANYTFTKATWGPYNLASPWASQYTGTGSLCGFDVAYSGATQTPGNFALLPDVDLVFTPDTSKWTRCAVIELQEDPKLSQGNASKFYLRNHAGWGLSKTMTSDGLNPVYSDLSSDYGMSWFPGYAIDQGTGKRLNIVFGEDSYLGSDNGNDMLWNPTSTQFNAFDASSIFGGKHIVYVFGTSYDSDKAFMANVKLAAPTNNYLRTAYSTAQWVGVPTLNPAMSFKSLGQGQIPTKTRLRFRVDRPYGAYAATDTTTTLGPIAGIPGQMSNPYYTFSTTDLAPTLKSDTTNRSRLLSRIYAVPNPYYGYSGYEANRFDTKVRIINLPAQATIYIYSLDGALIRTLSKDDASTSYIDWDIKNTVGLPVASGMYLMDVKAVGIGETVLKWFGAMRPIDVTTY